MKETVKTLLYSTEFTRADGKHHFLPLTARQAADGLGPFINRIGSMNANPVTIILAGETPDAFGIPWDSPEDWDTAETEHPVLKSIRDAGWSTPKLWPWMRCEHPDHPDVIVLVHDWADPDECPLITPSETLTERALYDWHVKTGVPWRSNGMLTGTALIRWMHEDAVLVQSAANARNPRQSRRKPPTAPRWQSAPAGVDGGEKPWTARTWGKGVDTSALAQVDANKAHLAAALSGLFARDALKPGPVEFDRKLSGYWLTEVSPWHDPEFPDPAGPYNGEAGDARWLSSETLALLAELHDSGIHGGFKIRRSLVAPGTQVLRPWAELLRDHLYEGTLPEAAIKAVYTRTIGGMGRPGGLIYRPDWEDTVKGRCRAIQWRKLWAVRTTTGIRPRVIQSDAVFFDLEESAHVLGCVNPLTGKEVFPLGPNLGQFKFFAPEGI